MSTPKDSADSEKTVLADLVVEDIGELISLAPPLPMWEPPGRSPWPPRLSDAAVASYDGRIVWLGSAWELKRSVRLTPDATRLSAAGGLVTPGFVDSHTHLVFAGSRADEFFLRHRGIPYREIARAGGGILRTMRETRNASPDALFESAARRIETMLRWGTTTAEIKSGYGLNLQSELKLLEVARRLGQETPMDVVTTFLGAHVVPPDSNPKNYLKTVTEVMIPMVAERGLARFCDVFCETGVFGLDEARQVLEAGEKFGLRPKVHAEQLTRLGGARLAAELGATSADHLEHASAEDLEAMARAGVVGGLLPGASLFLGSEEYAPLARMRRADLEVALATDCNPGTCMTEVMPPILFLAVVKLGMTPGEALRAACLGGAKSLDMENQIGSLAPGKQMDLAVFDVPNLEELFYHFGVNHLQCVIKKGIPVAIP